LIRDGTEAKYSLNKGPTAFELSLELAPGKYHFFYLVDGNKQHTDQCPNFRDQLSGTIFNILTVTNKSTQSEIPYHGEEFSQFEPLTVRITNILRQYPDGSQILKEMLQNADDAKARKVSIVFDRRHNGTSKLFADSLQLFQGPALYVYNSALFEERDFESLRRLGASKKWDDMGKTGRFGIGFNSVYHITDLPCFRSGSYLVMLDPHARFLPGDTQCYGKRWDLVGHSGLSEEFPDQIAPFDLFCKQEDNFYNGTLFRLPLRTAEIAPHSQISKRPYTFEMVEELFASFMKEGARVLLFLKFVECIELLDWHEGASAPELVFSLSITNIDENIRKSRSSMNTYVGDPDFLRGEMKYPPVSCQMNIKITGKEGSVEEEWLTCSQMGGGRASVMAKSEFKEAIGLRLVPWSGVGGKLPKKGTEIDAGQLFCFLPLPTQTGFPLHINGSFELSLNRRDIWRGEDLGGQGKKKSDWNKFLLEDVLAVTYSSFLLNSVANLPIDATFDAHRYYSCWPDNSSLGIDWKFLSHAVYRYIANNSLPILYSVRGGGCMVGLNEACFVEGEVVPGSMMDVVISFLMFQSVAVVTPPAHIISGFKEIGKIINVTPKLVRKVLKELPKDKIEGHPFLKESQLSSLLRYCISDNDYKDLQSVPLLPLLDGTTTFFSLRAPKQEKEYFISNTFSSLFLPERSYQFVNHEVIDEDILKVVSGPKFTSVLNVTVLTMKIAAQVLFIDFLPSGWKGKVVEKSDEKWRVSRYFF